MPTVIDLFAGAGGLSLGAARAGFKLKAAVEKDPQAIQTNKLNFPNSIHIDKDIGKLKGSELLTLSGLLPGELTGLIGGPPCQGFSFIGRRDAEDARNNLFDHFFRLVNELRPAFFMAENVPGIMSPNYNDLREKAFARVKKNYVMLDPMPIKASDYGVPTIRKRVFFIGYDPKRFSKELCADEFLPPKNVERILVKNALSGLPEIIPSEWNAHENGWQKIVKTNGNRFMAKITGEIPKGIGNPAAIKRYLDKSEVSGCIATAHNTEIEKRYGDLERGKQDKVSKSVKLDPEGHCPTLRAGTGSDKGSYQAVRPIHPSQPRVITPREAARLQGFPDWFEFHPTKWHSFRQIGNSVSPIVAEYLLRVIRLHLKKNRSVGNF